MKDTVSTSKTRERSSIERKAEPPECDRIRKLVDALDDQIKALYREQDKLFDERDAALRRAQELDQEIARLNNQLIPSRLRLNPIDAINLAFTIARIRRLEAERERLRERARQINNRELAGIRERIRDKDKDRNKQLQDLARLGCTRY